MDFLLMWVDAGVGFAKYNKFLIENIQVHLADDAAYKAVDPTELKAMTDYLYKAIVKALKPTYEVGRKYVVDTSQNLTNTVTTGVNDYVASFSTWAYAKQAFDGWAADFRKWLDRVHGR